MSAALSLPESVPSQTASAPVAIRLIGVLDRVLIESFTDACVGLAAAGRRTFVIALRDLVTARDESLTRFVATLEALRDAGHDVYVDARAGWRKHLGIASPAFAEADDEVRRRSRRQIIIAHNADRH